CNDCHVEPLYEQSLATTCHGCHQDDDVHKGSQGEDCQGCHTETSWTEVPMFDHALTRFPLLGEHDNLECGDCHETQLFTDTASDCASCHIEDDPHENRFGDDCESCHNPVAWDLWFFDHNAQTDFLLDGAHVEVSCESCHRASLKSMLGNDEQCADCHRADDVHDGEFGTDCGRCHSASNFKEVRSLQ
ncbi:MAG: hypothetical protein KDI09_14930, partial [Halioglobus sp.]|nr:hypothetical protein [Halioglobus sp.]